jgi:hypothetical protein
MDVHVSRISIAENMMMLCAASTDPNIFTAKLANMSVTGNALIFSLPTWFQLYPVFIEVSRAAFPPTGRANLLCATIRAIDQTGCLRFITIQVKIG